jgi:hypothetical protein
MKRLFPSLDFGGIAFLGGEFHMARKLVSAAFLFVVVTSAGCLQGARMVQKDANGGIVAIPQNTDMWPNYYRTDALKLIREQHSPNFEIVSEGEVVVGQQTQNNERIENRKIGPDGKPVGNLTTGFNTTTTSDVKEYRIQYRIKPMAIVGVPKSDNLIPAGGIEKSSTGLGPTGKPLNEQPPIDPRTGQPVSQFNNFGTK